MPTPGSFLLHGYSSWLILPAKALSASFMVVCILRGYSSRSIPLTSQVILVGQSHLTPKKPFQHHWWPCASSEVILLGQIPLTFKTLLASLMAILPTSKAILVGTSKDLPGPPCEWIFLPTIIHFPRFWFDKKDSLKTLRAKDFDLKKKDKLKTLRAKDFYLKKKKIKDSESKIFWFKKKKR